MCYDGRLNDAFRDLPLMLVGEEEEVNGKGKSNYTNQVSTEVFLNFVRASHRFQSRTLEGKPNM